uniref:Caspase recruitment domain family member 9 n=1 Tax=Callorhinchus milii TaxID=7868 RepID=A0A4W3IW03_CALMI
MSENEDADVEELWTSLESYRAKLTSLIEPCRITAYLRQCKVINHEDEEQIFNDPNLVIRRRKVGVLLDILQRTGKKGYIAFLESLELYYPELYKRITGQDPTRTFSVILDAGGESSLTQLLMAEVQKQQQVVLQEKKKVNELNRQVVSRDELIKQLQVKANELLKHQQRVRRLKEESDKSCEELKRCKEENYKWAKDFATLSEEKNSVLMKNRDLQLEVERLKHNLMLAEDGYKMERTHTMKLKHAMEQQPRQELIWDVQRENDLLKAHIQELENTVQVDKLDKNKMYIQILEADRRLALEEHQGLVNNIYSLRKELRQAEELRDQYLEEKEVFELQCTTLRKDSKMYKDRIEAILHQMEEVGTERDQALQGREELLGQYSQSLREKDEYRKLLRELGERCDELHIQLFRKEEQLLSLQNRVKQSQSASPTAVRTSAYSPRRPLGAAAENAAEKKNVKQRMPKIFKDYRRKRAIRLNKRRVHHLSERCENTTGSDNTDTDFSEGDGRSNVQ